jgi:nucleotide-binding universal stress UspA family protein
LAVDLGEESSWSKALPTALELVRNHEARLHVMTVVPDFGFSVVGQYFPKDYEHKMVTDMQRRLREFVTTHVPKDVTVHDIIGHGPVYSEILDAAESVKADLIVLASHRPGLQDYLIGPNASKVVRHAKCSVLVVRE